MADIITQFLEYKELIAIVLGGSAIYWQLDKRVSILEGWCNPFFSKMFEESIDRVITGNN